MNMKQCYKEELSPCYFPGKGLFAAFGVNLLPGPERLLQVKQNILVALLEVHWVLCPQELIGSNQRHVPLDHEVLDDAGRSKGEPIKAVHQDALLLLSGGIYTFVDVAEAELLVDQALCCHGQVPDVHLEPGPTVPASTGARAGDEEQAALRRHVAHVDDAVDVAAAQRQPAVSCVQVAHIDVVRHFGDDGFTVMVVACILPSGFHLRLPSVVT